MGGGRTRLAVCVEGVEFEPALLIPDVLITDDLLDTVPSEIPVHNHSSLVARLLPLVKGVAAHFRIRSALRIESRPAR